jgi:hypothetical protein
VKLIAPVEPNRSCIGCTLCCTVMGIDDLPKVKWPYDRCPHQGQGCKIYADRPTSCREWSCAWVLGHLPYALKPSKTGLIFGIGDGHQWFVKVSKAGRRVWEEPDTNEILLRLSAKGPVILAIDNPSEEVGAVYEAGGVTVRGGTDA